MLASPGPARVSTGVCSVSFRQLDPGTIISAAAGAGLDGIEWGSDIHVPVGDIGNARAIADATESAGLRVLSYGSYWRAEDDRFSDVLHTAAALRAARIRVWAGTTGSAETSPNDRDAIVLRLRTAATLAADLGVEIGLEFHSGTLTDTSASTLSLVTEIGSPNLFSYWQPPLDFDDGSALAGLDGLIRLVSTVHVFSWWPGTERLPLRERSALWAAVCDRVVASELDHDLVLEFMPDDDPELLGSEADTLREFISGAFSRRRAG